MTIPSSIFMLICFLLELTYEKPEKRFHIYKNEVNYNRYLYYILVRESILFIYSILSIDINSNNIY
jgi:hypothetical protein